MSLKFTDFLREAFEKVFGGNAIKQEQPEQTFVEMDRKALTIAVIKEFETKKRTGDSIANMWDNISDLLVEGLGPEEEMDDREVEYFKTVRSVAQIIRETNSFSDTLSIPQRHIDILYSNRDIVNDAKNAIAATTSDLPDGAKGGAYIEDDIEQGGIHFPQSEFEAAISTRVLQLADFVFKLNSTIKPHVSEDAEPNRLNL